MKLLDLTLKSPAENLALDEALLEGVSAHGDLLRLWESEQPAVIVGRASRVDTEVNRPECDRRGVPVLRRCSGGAAVVIGPGCLMYSVILATDGRPALNVVDQTHHYVLRHVRQALTGLQLPVILSGTSDLTLNDQKFSGNSLRCRRDGVLYHGTLLYDADIAQIEACLKMPPRQPDYRQQRRHAEFLMNLPVESHALRAALAQAWNCAGSLSTWPQDATRRLAQARYGQDEWNFAR